MYLIKSCPFQTDHMQVRTRFAPSPTGFMHLGNIWIALLNWLWTRQNKGKIVLRIEDIDTQRSKPSYIQGILDDLPGWDWILMRPGHSFSYGDTIQSQRTHLYEETCRDLLKQGELYLASAPVQGFTQSVQHRMLMRQYPRMTAIAEI